MLLRAVLAINFRTSGIASDPNRVSATGSEKERPMSIKTNLLRAGTLGIVLTALSAGAAFAAVATSSVNIRSGPGTSYRVLGQLAPGEHVAITNRTGGWCEISRPNGWVSCAYLAHGAGSASLVQSYPYPDSGYLYDTPSVDVGVGLGSHWPRPWPPMHHTWHTAHARTFPLLPPYGMPGHGEHTRPWWQH